MCFDADSEPPIPRIAGAAVSHDDLDAHLRRRDRVRRLPGDARRRCDATGVVILPDVRGLYRFYEELALRFAERGYAAIAIDYFGRTAGAAKRDEGFEYMPHVDQTTDDGVQADTHAGVDKLRALGVGSVFTVGFCFGGRASWVAGGVGPRSRRRGRLLRQSDAGARRREPGRARRADRVPDPRAAGGRRPEHHRRGQRRVRRGAGRRGRRARDRQYDGAPHSFFDRKQEEFQADSDDAWRRTLEFIAAHA